MNKKPFVLWKSHFSIGKSILTLDDVPEEKDRVEGAADSIFEILKENKLTTAALVDESLTGFPDFKKGCEKYGIKPLFGLRLAMRNSAAPEDSTTEHYNVILAKDSEGCKLLNKISTKSNCDFEGFLTYAALKDLWNNDHLKLSIPFYDSFIFVNNLTFANAVPDFSFCKPTVFIEDNNVALDLILADKAKEYATAHNFPLLWTKSVYYRDKKDIKAFMTYKIICDRKFGKNRSFEKPELNHFCSDEFSFESWKEVNL